FEADVPEEEAIRSASGTAIRSACGAAIAGTATGAAECVYARCPEDVSTAERHQCRLSNMLCWAWSRSTPGSRGALQASYDFRAGGHGGCTVYRASVPGEA